MNIGIVADGHAEVEALSHLFAKLDRPNLRLLKPLYADMQPYAPPAQIVRASESRLTLLSERGATRHIVLLDRENNPQCPGEVAQELQREYQRRGHGQVTVVLKNRAFENWLIADPRALAAGSGTRRIAISERMIERIEGSGADNLNAIAVLEGSIKDGYNKRSDAIEICKRVNPMELSRNSRSFRKLLLSLGLN